MMFRAKALFVGIFLVYFGFGQSLELNFHQLTVDNGLSQSWNDFLYVDKQGYTWISSLDGLNRFDGKSVRVFKPTPNDETSIKGLNIQSPFFEDYDGNIWFATNEALNCYNRKQGNFRKKFEKEFSHAEWINHVFHIEKEQYLWLILNEKLCRYDIREDSVHTIDNFIAIRASTAIDSNRGVKTIFGCFWNRQNGLEILSISPDYKVNSRKTWFDKPGNPGPVLIVSQVVPEDENSAWFLTDQGILYFDVRAPNRFSLISPPNKDFPFTSFFSVSSEEIWALSGNSTLTVISKTGKKIVKQSKSLLNLDKKVFIDGTSRIINIQEGILWLSSIGDGIYFSNIKNKKFTNVFYENGFPEAGIKFLFEAKKGEIECLEKNGKSWRFQDKIPFLNRIPASIVLDKVIDSGGERWIISKQGFGRYQRESSAFNLLYPSDSVGKFFDLANYDEQFLVLATDKKGIVFFDKNKKEVIPTLNKNWVVRTFIDEKKRLWTSNISEVLTVWKAEFSDGIKLLKLKELSQEGLIRDIAEDRRRKAIWVGTSKGLIRINSETLEQEALLTEQEGLPNQFINAIVIDNRGCLWLSSNRGLICYMPEAPPGRQFKHYTSRDGLSSDEYLPGARLLSSNGEIWFGGAKGVDVFHPDKVKDVGRAPKLGLNEIFVHGKDGNNKPFSGNLKEIKLKHWENTLTLEFAAMEYTDPYRNQFKVYLKYDGRVDSSFLNSNNRITYANLAPGDYLFQFTACNAEGIWQKDPYSLKITISPPFYQTWWFRTLVIVWVLALASFITMLYYRARLKEKELELEKQQRAAERAKLILEKTLMLQTERSRISKEMHDELTGGLSSIRNISERARKRQVQEEVQQPLSRISTLAIQLLKNMRAIIWAMEPGNDTLRDLVAHIRRNTKEFLSDNGLADEIQVPENLPEVTMSGKVRHNLSLVVREALHNIVKHAEAGVVVFNLTIESELLTIIIKDDGKGFDLADIPKTGTGLRNMQNRMKDISGTIEWERRESGGMCIRIQQPLGNGV